jgi:hypothetical protein
MFGFDLRQAQVSRTRKPSKILIALIYTFSLQARLRDLKVCGAALRSRSGAADR